MCCLILARALIKNSILHESKALVLAIITHVSNCYSHYLGLNELYCRAPDYPREIKRKFSVPILVPTKTDSTTWSSLDGTLLMRLRLNKNNRINRKPLASQDGKSQTVPMSCFSLVLLCLHRARDHRENTAWERSHSLWGLWLRVLESSLFQLKTFQLENEEGKEGKREWEAQRESKFRENMMYLLTFPNSLWPFCLRKGVCSWKAQAVYALWIRQIWACLRSG